ncbi:OsmC family protein [Sphingobacterium sp. BIGb0165]|uniref:OsmC family protein n=1 Tax=Sphingobacterium sp. BIGb0165 TaxID=2940615 RepID=UPI00216A7894|nr:OsmC family protein [Sphingobacterium sp. BIGb0165]MCS4224339.1 putative redox protein [Sphingobacterium sp. BIGb0165]
MMENEVIVTIGEIPYTTTVQYGKHQIIVDEPEDLGGQDQGISPTPLLLSSLGTCKAVTVKMYADRKNWPLEEVKIRLSHEIQTSEQQQTTYIQCHISFKGDLDDEQKKRLFKIAEKCPVHKILTNPIVITSNHL